MLQKLGVVVNTKEKIIISPYSSLNQVPIPERYYIRQMIRLGFIIQTTLF